MYYSRIKQIKYKTNKSLCRKITSYPSNQSFSSSCSNWPKNHILQMTNLKNISHNKTTNTVNEVSIPPSKKVVYSLSYFDIIIPPLQNFTFPLPYPGGIEASFKVTYKYLF